MPDALYNRVLVGSEGIFWNDSPIDQAKLEELLGLTAKMPSKPAVLLTVKEGVDCNTVHRIRSVVEKQTGCGSKQTCHEIREADWARIAPDPSSLSPPARP